MEFGPASPKRIAAFGGAYEVNDNREVPDTAKVIWEYDKALVSYDQINANGNAPKREYHFRATKGMLLTYSGGYEIQPDAIREKGRLPPNAVAHNSSATSRPSRSTRGPYESWRSREMPCFSIR